MSALATGTWTDAPSSPPDNNTEAPINVGSIFQIKTGKFALGAQKTYSPESGRPLLDINGIASINALVAGSLTVGGTPTSGQVLAAQTLVKDASNNVIGATVGWATPSGSSGTTASLDALCRTTWIPPYRVDWGGISDDATIRRSITPVSLLINGRNICTDDNGCTYRIWQTSPTYPQGFNFYGTSPIMFRQVASGKIGAGKWIDALDNQKGTNGDDVRTDLIGGSSNYGTFLMDDLDYEGNLTDKPFITNVNDIKNPGSSSFLWEYPNFTPSITISNDIWWSDGVGGSVREARSYSEHSPDWVSFEKVYYDGEIDPVVDIVTICDL